MFKSGKMNLNLWVHSAQHMLHTECIRVNYDVNHDFIRCI